jgi:hypothetical protein
MDVKMPVIGSQHLDSECCRCGRKFGPNYPSSSVEKNGEYADAIIESEHQFPRHSIVCVENMRQFVQGWLRVYPDEDKSKVMFWIGPEQGRAFDRYFSLNPHTRVSNEEASFLGIKIKRIPLDGMSISAVAPVYRNNGRLVLNITQLSNLTVEHLADHRRVRKIDLVPPFPPEGWTDPYPDKRLDDIVMMHHYNKRMVVKGRVMLDIKPQPMALEFFGCELAASPTSEWRTVKTGQAVVTDLELTCYAV